MYVISSKQLVRQLKENANNNDNDNNNEQHAINKGTTFFQLLLNS